MTAALLLSAGIAYPGFALLCLGMQRHQRQVLRKRSLPARLRMLAPLVGWIFLAASLVPALGVPNPGIGLVTWAGILILAAAPLTIGLPYLPRTVGLVGPSVSFLAAGFYLVFSGASGS